MGVQNFSHLNNVYVSTSLYFYLFLSRFVAAVFPHVSTALWQRPHAERPDTFGRWRLHAERGQSAQHQHELGLFQPAAGGEYAEHWQSNDGHRTVGQ